MNLEGVVGRMLGVAAGAIATVVLVGLLPETLAFNYFVNAGLLLGLAASGWLVGGMVGDRVGGTHD